MAGSDSRALHEVELGARRQSCDWEFDSRSEGLELNMSELQEMRTLARLIAVRVRVAVLENKLDEAIDWLQTGLAMARHVSQGPIFIQSLIGLALCGQLTRPMEELIQDPGCPASTGRWPIRPVRSSTSIRPWRANVTSWRRSFPSSASSMASPGAWRSRGHCRRAGDQVLQARGLGTADRSDWLPKLGLAAIVAQAYPEAKRALIAQGRPAAEGSDADFPGRRPVHLSVLSGPSR